MVHEHDFRDPDFWIFESFLVSGNAVTRQLDRNLNFSGPGFCGISASICATTGRTEKCTNACAISMESRLSLEGVCNRHSSTVPERPKAKMTPSSVRSDGEVYRPVWDGGVLRFGISREMVRSETSIPTLSSSHEFSVHGEPEKTSGLRSGVRQNRSTRRHAEIAFPRRARPWLSHWFPVRIAIKSGSLGRKSVLWVTKA